MPLATRSRHARRRQRRLGLLLAGLSGLFGGAACAASLQVAPILVELAHGEQAEALWLSNAGERPIRAQVRVMGWTQVTDADRLEPSRDLVPSPPIVEIAPGQQQLVRIVRPQSGAVRGELAYRLLVDELPDPQQAPGAGLQFLLQYSVPVFVLPEGATPRDAPGARPPSDVSLLSTSVQGEGDDSRLTVVNRGPSRVRLSQLAHVDAAGVETALVPGLLGYVLAGQSMQWPLTLPPGGLRDARLKARLNDDQDAQILPLSPPR